jgi:hypothetical protein
MFRLDTLKRDCAGTSGDGFGSEFNQVSGSGFGTGSGSRRAKMTHKNRKKIKKFNLFLFEGCRLLLWLGRPLWRQGIGKSQFLILKKLNFSISCTFFSIFGYRNPGSVFCLKCWIGIHIRIRNTGGG